MRAAGAEIGTNVDVLVVGAGPVGLLLAQELAMHGVRSMLVDGATEPTQFPKMDITNARSMELFRRMGIAQEVRDAGVGAAHSFDVLWTSGFESEPVTTWRLPSVSQQRAAIAASNDGTLPLEPYQRISQAVFESLGRTRAAATDAIDFRAGWSFDALQQDRDGVRARLRSVDDGRDLTVRCRYLVGCDGGSSSVRRAVGVGLEGSSAPFDVMMVHFRSEDRSFLHRYGQFWHVFSSAGLALISQDEDVTWTGHIYLSADDLSDRRDPARLLQQRLGGAFEIDEVLLTSVWRPQMLLADRYRVGRVLLAGDAVHQVIPTGGYGMNTGVGDAVDLGWKLAAVVRGWAGPSLLDSYEAERRPVASVNRAMAGRHAHIHAEFSRLMLAGTHPKEVATFLQDERGENEFLGVELDYRYDDSPVVWQEEGEPPSWDARRYTPSTWPGARPPSVRLESGRPIFDLLTATTFTLVDFVGDGAGAAVAATAHERGIPLRRVVLADAHARDIWERDLVLVRPDQHVAWRGNTAPSDLGSVLDRVSGRWSASEPRQGAN